MRRIRRRQGCSKQIDDRRPNFNSDDIRKRIKIISRAEYVRKKKEEQEQEEQEEQEQEQEQEQDLEEEEEEEEEEEALYERIKFRQEPIRTGLTRVAA
ncbi:hypothetical protein ACROYT_G031261 [Oculina patagonica]